MNEDLAALAAFDGTVRLFPLSNLVFFPHTVQGLHIFEPRYRDMAADALNDDQLIALVLLPDVPEQAYLDVPTIETTACLGRITQAEIFPDGRYNMRIKGIARIRIVEEYSTDRTYRTARAELLPDVIPDDVKLLTALRKELAEAVLPRFEPTAPAFRHLVELFSGETPLGALCDMLAYALPLDAELKQMLLAESMVHLRAQLLTAALQPDDDDVGFAGNANRNFPPEFSEN